MNMNLDWTFGINTKIYNGLYNISNVDVSNRLLYTISQYGIIYDYNKRKQIILQGHCNEITCCCVSVDNNIIITCDSGPNSILVVWNASSGLPIKSIENPHANGTISVSISSDNLYFVTLGKPDELNLQMSIWSLANDEDCLLSSKTLGKDFYSCTSISFHLYDSKNIIIWGNTDVVFCNWINLEITFVSITLKQLNRNSSLGNFTSSSYLNNSNFAITTTDTGYAILWDLFTNIHSFDVRDTIKKTAKFVKLVQTGILVCTITKNNYILVGCKDGTIKVYNFSLKLEAWWDDFSAGPIISISPVYSNMQSNDDIPDFIFLTSNSLVIGVESSSFNDILGPRKLGSLLMQGMSGVINSVTCHGNKSIIAICSNQAVIQLWNYELKLLVIMRNFIESHESLYHPISTCVYSHFSEKDESFLVLGSVDGTLRVLDGYSLDDIAVFHCTNHEILGIKWNLTNKYFASFDSQGKVMLFKCLEDKKFTYIGASLSHSNRIVSLEFFQHNSAEILLSLDEEAFCVHYDVNASTEESGLLFYDQNESVTALDAYRKASQMFIQNLVDNDSFYVLFDDQVVKRYDLLSKKCISTTKFPFESGQINNIKYFDHGKYVFSNSGIIALGEVNSNGKFVDYFSLQGHSDIIKDVNVSSDKKIIFSFGESDLCMNMWRILDENKAVQACPDEENSWYHDFVDYFYLCRLLSSIDNIDKEFCIPISYIPKIFQALGFFLSQNSFTSMMEEAAHKDLAKTGVITTSIDMDTLKSLLKNNCDYHENVSEKSKKMQDLMLMLPFKDNKERKVEVLSDILNRFGEKIEVPIGIDRILDM